MRLHVLAVGRLKTGPEKLLSADYAQRIALAGRQAGITKLQVNEFGDSSLSTTPLRQADEAKLLTSALTKQSFNIVLDERGTAPTSANFAQLIRTQLAHSCTDMAFLIGGADGHADTTRQNADYLLSFGAMTWPHRLVRIMLLEQIYRAITILNNHPYHRG